jgi:hypothetical protein
MFVKLPFLGSAALARPEYLIEIETIATVWRPLGRRHVAAKSRRSPHSPQS